MKHAVIVKKQYFFFLFFSEILIASQKNSEAFERYKNWRGFAKLLPMLRLFLCTTTFI